MLVHLVNAVCVYHKDVSNLRAECSFYMLREDEVEVEGGGTELLGGVFWDTTMWKPTYTPALWSALEEYASKCSHEIGNVWLKCKHMGFLNAGTG